MFLFVALTALVRNGMSVLALVLFKASIAFSFNYDSMFSLFVTYTLFLYKVKSVSLIACIYGL
jgi:hypothetical protein